MGEVIGLIGSIACLGGLIYSLYRIHVLEKRLSQYEEKENRDGECLERVEKQVECKSLRSHFGLHTKRYA